MLRFLMILAAALMLSAPSAQAYSDCASTLGQDFGALLRGAATAAELIGNDDKAETDAYKLLARAAPMGSPVAKLGLMSSAVVLINCAALEGRDEEAATIRQQLAALMPDRPTNVTAARVQKWLGKRLSYGTPGQFHLLGTAEQQAFSHLLCHAAEVAGTLNKGEAMLVEPFRQLAEDAQLPPCGG